MLERRDSQWIVPGETSFSWMGTQSCIVALAENLLKRRMHMPEPKKELVESEIHVATSPSPLHLPHPHVLAASAVPCDGPRLLCQTYRQGAAPMSADTVALRLVQTLHATDNVQLVEMLRHCRTWQPACTMPEENLTQHFAKQADASGCAALVHKRTEKSGSFLPSQ